MSEVTVRANQAMAGWADGEVKTVERTAYLDKLLDGGRVSLVEEPVPAVAAPADEAANRPADEDPNRPAVLGKPDRSAPVSDVRAFAEQESGESLADLTKAQLWALIDREG